MISYRMQRINSEIQRIVSAIINDIFGQTGIFVTINYVDTYKDLSSAKVYVSLFSRDKKTNFKELLKKRNIIQKRFSRSIKLRYTPKLEYILDTKQEEINEIEKILDKIRKKDEN